MTFLIAAAGTGGHVFPGLAVGEALVDLGVGKDDVLYVGGARLESSVYPGFGFPFLRLELRGLQRSMTTRNLALPRLVWRARNRILEVVEERKVKVALGMGGYFTIPIGLAARRAGVPLMIAEQNAGAGLANRVASRWAARRFASFPLTRGMVGAEWVGNPVRSALVGFDRENLRSQALDRYSLDHEVPVLGVIGGSLGADVINEAVSTLVAGWEGPDLQVVHLTGETHETTLAARSAPSGIRWRRLGFENQMEGFYAVSDLVVARAGGGVAELTATGTPSVLVPGEFGSSGHQRANAAFLGDVGAAIVLSEAEIGALPQVVLSLLFDRQRLDEMGQAAARVGKPEAAQTIALAMMETAG